MVASAPHRGARTTPGEALRDVNAAPIATDRRGLPLAGLFVIALLAFALRVAVAAKFQGLAAPPDAASNPDPLDYEAFAWSVADGHGYALADGTRTARRPPGTSVALLPVYARDILEVGPTGLGLLRSAPALGATLMAVVLAVRPIVRRAGPVLFACVAVFGAATVVFGLSKSFALSLAALLVAGAADMVSVFVRHTLVQLGTPDAMRGRVSAVNLAFIGASNELGEFESGLAAAWLGTVWAVVTGGIATIGVVVAWAWLFPSLRRVDRLDAGALAPPPRALDAS